MAEPVPDIVGLLPQRACRNCMQIKVKCVARKDVAQSSASCERCHRLGKACTTPAPVLRRKPREKSSKVAQLEDRINRLTNLLTPQSSPEGTSHTTSTRDTNHLQSEKHVLNQSESDGDSQLRGTICQQEEDDLPSFQCTAPLSSKTLETPATEPQHEGLATILAPPHLVAAKYKLKVPPAKFCPMFLDPELETTLFNLFRTEMSPSFPFVLIPNDETIESIKKDRPFLYWSACAVASFSRRALQSTLNSQLLQSIGDQILSKAHKSPDLLQGVLILIAWNHYYSHLNPQIVSLIHLARALVIDLGFSQPLHSRNRSRLMIDLTDMYHGRQVVIGIRSDEDRRGLLGVFVLASRMALCLPRVEPMPFTQYMDKCCRELESNAVLKSDLLVVYLTKLHHIAWKYMSFDSAMSSLPSRHLLATLVDELETFKRHLPQTMIDNTDLLMEIESCTFTLLGPTRFGDHESRDDAVEPLYAALAAMKRFIEQVSAMMPQQTVSMTPWFNISYIIGAWAELSFLNIESWNLQYVREVYDFAAMMRVCLDVFERCQRYYEEMGQSDDLIWRFGLYADKVKKCIKWYETKVGLEQRNGAPDDLSQEIQFLDNFATSLFDDLADPIWDNMSGDWARF